MHLTMSIAHPYCAPVMSDADCNDALGAVSEDIVCLDAWGQIYSGVDSGAPGTVNSTATNPGMLVGVNTLSRSGSPIGLTSVEYHIDWINGV